MLFSKIRTEANNGGKEDGWRKKAILSITRCVSVTFNLALRAIDISMADPPLRDGSRGRGGRYLVFAFPAFVPTGRDETRTMNRVNHFRVFNYSAHVLANRSGRFTAISSIVFHRGRDGFIRFRRYQLARGEGSGYAVLLFDFTPDREIMPRFDEICQPRPSLLRAFISVERIGGGG